MLNTAFMNLSIHSHNPYFNRWFSAMFMEYYIPLIGTGHNPYFNRWFSAITNMGLLLMKKILSQSLF